MKNTKNNNIAGNRHQASRILVGLAGVLFLIFSVQFFKIMVLGNTHGVDLRAEINDKIHQKRTLAAKRGTIYDASGSPIAVDATNYSLYAVLTSEWSKNADTPDYVTDVNKTAEALSKHISLSKEEIAKLLSQKDVSQVEFGTAGKNLSVQVKEKIEAEKLPGIKFSESPARYYPNGIFASHLIGYTDTVEETVDNKTITTLVGKTGLEGLYNDQLTGTAGEVEYSVDGNGYVITDTEKVTKQPKDGMNLTLTIDKRLQTYLESLVSQADKNYQPVQMTAMLVDPKTGNIIAATQRPTYNSTTKEGINVQWNNLLMEQAFEPGSTMKVLALAAAINEGVFDPNEKYKSGSVKIYTDLVRDYNKVGWGTITYLEGLAHSSNVAFVHIIQKIGVEKWKQYLEAFGFGKSTNSGFVNEVSGSNPFNSYLQQLSTGFGQGITVTPYQMMQAFTAITNGGQMQKLRLVDHLTDPDTGKETPNPTTALGKVISPETAKKTLQFLYEATRMKNGIAYDFNIDGEKVAAKTGTAEIINPETGKYYSNGNNYIFSVVGFAPYDDPKYILYITVKQPRVAVTGNQIIKEIFNPLMKRSLEYSRLSE